jgi:hypothetical protein
MLNENITIDANPRRRKMRRREVFCEGDGYMGEWE